MRDLNIAGRDVNVKNTGEPKSKHWFNKLLSWLRDRIFVALFVAILGGAIVAFITFQMGW